MRRHQGIQLLQSGAPKRITPLPGENLLAQALAPLSYGFREPPGAHRAAPRLAQGLGLTRIQKTCLPEPGQERRKVREHFGGLPSHERARVDEVHGKLISHEEGLGPINRFWSGAAHVSSGKM